MYQRIIDGIIVGVIVALICTQFSFFPALLFSEFHDFKSLILSGGLCLLTILLLGSRDIEYSINPIFLVVLCFAGIHGISFLWAAHPSMIWSHFVGWIMVALILLISSSLPERIIKQNIFPYLFLVIIITNIIHLYYSFYTVVAENNFSIHTNVMKQIALKYDLNSNYLSSLILLYIPVLAEIRKKRIQVKKICIVTIFSIILIIPFFNSRATSIALVLILLIYVCIEKSKLTLFLKAHSKLIAFVTVLFIILFLSIENKPYFLKSYNPLSGIVDDDRSDRISLWTNTFNLIKEKPFFGHGSGNWITEIYKFGYNDYENGIFYTHAHNVWLQTLAEIGIVGTFMLLLICILISYRSIHLKEWNIFCAFLIWIFCASFYSLYISANGYFHPHLYLSFAFCGLLYNKKKSSNSL